MVKLVAMNSFHILVNRFFSSTRSSHRIVFQNNFKYSKNNGIHKFEETDKIQEIENPTNQMSRGNQTERTFKRSRGSSWWNNNEDRSKSNRLRASESANSHQWKDIASTPPREDIRRISLDQTKEEDWTYLRYSKNKKNKRKMCPQLDGISDLHEDNEVLFGYHPVLLALQAQRRTLHRVFYRKGIEENNKINTLISKCVMNNIEIFPCDIQTLDRLSDGRPHQGICAIVSPLETHTLTKEHVDEGAPSLWLLLDRIHDPMNFGAVLRSAYFLGVDKIITCSEGSCRLSPVVSKASAGVLEIEPVFAVPDLTTFLKERSSWNIWGAAGACDDVSPVHDVRHCTIDKPTILIVGNEGDGIQKELRPLMHRWVQVCNGRKLECGIDSLNVGAATAILIHTLNNNRAKNITEDQQTLIS